MPLMFGFRSNQIQLKAGPYLAYALSGKMEAKQNGVIVSLDLLDGSFGGKFNRLDAGLNFGASMDLSKQFSINIDYQLGLASMYPKSFQGQNIGTGYNRNVVISLSYYFE